MYRSRHHNESEPKSYVTFAEGSKLPVILILPVDNSTLDVGP